LGEQRSVNLSFFKNFNATASLDELTGENEKRWKMLHSTMLYSYQLIKQIS